MIGQRRGRAFAVCDHRFQPTCLHDLLLILIGPCRGTHCFSVGNYANGLRPGFDAATRISKKAAIDNGYGAEPFSFGEMQRN
jgi:hypothetical protein